MKNLVIEIDLEKTPPQAIPQVLDIIVGKLKEFESKGMILYAVESAEPGYIVNGFFDNLDVKNKNNATVRLFTQPYRITRKEEEITWGK